MRELRLNTRRLDYHKMMSAKKSCNKKKGTLEYVINNYVNLEG